MMPNTAPEDLQHLSQRFRHFGIQHRKEPSVTLYSDIACGIADDPVMLSLAQNANSRPIPQLFLAVVHFLLLRGIDHPLRSFFPDLNAGLSAQGNVYPAFRSFCLDHREQILQLLIGRRTQTNEVGRCIYLALGFAILAQMAPRFGVIDVGCSAGLHLLWRKYGYDYEGHRLGDPNAVVQLKCHFKGLLRPALPDVWPEPLMQIGIDLHCLRVDDADDRLWLQSLIWPEFSDRAQLLQRALTMAQQSPPRIVAGDACEVLRVLADDFSPNAALVVCHCHVLNQFSPEQRAHFDSLLSELSSSRDVYRLSAEWISTQSPEFTAYHYRKGRKSQRVLAKVNDSLVQWLDCGDWVESADQPLYISGPN